jgi:hypothetical protein
LYNAKQVKIDLEDFLRKNLHENAIEINAMISGCVSIDHIFNMSVKPKLFKLLGEFVAKNFSYLEIHVNEELAQNEEMMMGVRNRVLEQNSTFASVYLRIETDRLIRACGSKKAVEKAVKRIANFLSFRDKQVSQITLYRHLSYCTAFSVPWYYF